MTGIRSSNSESKQYCIWITCVLYHLCIRNNNNALQRTTTHASQHIHKYKQTRTMPKQFYLKGKFSSGYFVSINFAHASIGQGVWPTISFSINTPDGDDGRHFKFELQRSLSSNTVHINSLLVSHSSLVCLLCFVCHHTNTFTVNHTGCFDRISCKFCNHS